MNHIIQMRLKISKYVHSSYSHQNSNKNPTIITKIHVPTTWNAHCIMCDEIIKL